MEKSISAAAGEFLVVGELLRRGINNSFLANGPNNTGWDIITIINEKIIKIQVKTISWPKITAVNGNFDNKNFDFLIVVLLNYSSIHKEPSRYFIFEFNEIDQFLSKYNENRQNNVRTITFSKTDINNKLLEMENAWGKIE